ncbi:hypothetical protein ACIQBJ_25955 [Kitasatospora sp. NPDC088391]|uniref:hypothetical protein n=1 Tax=Kitasatospora sp. NPDC088391 TaxID=3364074 RepID=UPI003825532A
MAKYSINSGYSDYRTIDAWTYRVEGDFIHFVDADNTPVLTVRAGQVYVIEREEPGAA